MGGPGAAIHIRVLTTVPTSRCIQFSSSRLIQLPVLREPSAFQPQVHLLSWALWLASLPRSYSFSFCSRLLANRCFQPVPRLACCASELWLPKLPGDGTQSQFHFLFFAGTYQH